MLKQINNFNQTKKRFNLKEKIKLLFLDVMLINSIKKLVLNIRIKL